ncbi:DUF4893 domain-containing protein [Sandarakinorhabdus sp. AAP62]|uniref:DUF4893 domain-containing protein n=1 Tax=Sandarakinorhabdus sp. AAP62 TaxID=1248916 RepID=UPI0003090A40|nr:DUF4893 domain-containing protein [Sandarakinorhabdus sp. AAP62]
MIRVVALLALLLLAGCSKEDELRPYAVVRRADVWQAVISDPDRGRLSRLSDAWEQARTDITEAGRDADLAALGPVAVDRPTASPAFPGAGTYQCRTILLGWRQGTPRTAPPVQASAWVPCTLAADGILLRLETAPGPQQYLGTLYPDVDRLIFLGTLRLAGDMGRLRYGEDAQRDQLGVLQAIGPNPNSGHWRIALPWPRWTARLVLIELRAA